MKSFVTSYGCIEQKNSSTLIATENDTGLYVSFKVIGIVILAISIQILVSFLFVNTGNIEITRNQIAQSLLTASATNYYWSIGFLSLLIISLALKLFIWGEENKQKYFRYLSKYLSGLLFFISVFLLISLTNIQILSQSLFIAITNFPVGILYCILILVLLFFVYIGISFWKSPYSYYRERITIFSKTQNTLIQKITRYPIPLIIYKNGNFNFASSWVEAKYEYPLSDIISIHRYTSEKSDEFTYFVMLLFSKTNTYFPTIESRNIKENNQVLDIISTFLSLPCGEDLSNLSSSFIKNHFLVSHNQKISISATMMMTENQRRLAENPHDPDACLMLGLAFMGINQFDAAIEKLQQSKILYEKLGERRQSVKVGDYLDGLQAYMASKSIKN
ncbi:hypothetical protein WJM97_10610 [Okeanomitos corallinicola TIOX110]|uniref:Uncharacterized protein n=1 Tax=Okeanomitos corallinicola TIOX110 TaxID=3133117 RepID=A0ABZ2UXQ4_9CYAN